MLGIGGQRRGANERITIKMVNADAGKGFSFHLVRSPLLVGCGFGWGGGRR